MELEQDNDSIENGLMDMAYELEDCNDEIFDGTLDGKMDELASLLVEKILADSRFNKVLNNSKELDHRSRDRRTTSEERDYRSKPIVKMADLIDRERKPLELNQKVKFAQQYLNVIKLIYSELQDELGENFYKMDGSTSPFRELVESVSSRQEDTAGFLLRLEKFVLILAYSATPAYIFDDEEVEDLEEEPINVIQRRITAIGYELLYFFNNLITIRGMNGSRYLSSHIQLFLKFMLDYKFMPDRNGRERKLLDQDIYFIPLNELNHVVLNLKKVLNKGEFEKQKPTFSLSVFRRSKASDNTIVGINATKFKDTVQNYSKRLQSAVVYFNRYKSSSITLYRFRMWWIAENDEISLKELKQFFGELNKKGDKKEAGFPGYLNFFYFWDKEDGQWFQDIVLIMDSDSLLPIEEYKSGESTRNIREEFEEFASKLLGHRSTAIFKEKKVRVKIQSVPLMRHLGLPSQLLIDIKDREAWNLFEKKILPFFLYHEFLQLDDDEKLKHRFSRGNATDEQSKEKIKK